MTSGQLRKWLLGHHGVAAGPARLDNLDAAKIVALIGGDVQRDVEGRFVAIVVSVILDEHGMGIAIGRRRVARPELDDEPHAALPITTVAFIAGTGGLIALISPAAALLGEFFSNVTLNIAEVQKRNHAMRFCFSDVTGKMMEIAWIENYMIAVRWPDQQISLGRFLVMRHPRPNLMSRNYSICAFEPESCIHQELCDTHQAEIGKAEHHPLAAWREVIMRVAPRTMKAGKPSHAPKQPAL
ncbi:hypothetical protein [Prosthecodimorpha hirschii]|uniref:hypothetical protein n=1 Tax=Prosthecodimorpha hirschii TaxID=665126 RepID=UPI00112E5F3E|nr:hypothetical protein [Prosthecomicrobium hirschii]